MSRETLASPVRRCVAGLLLGGAFVPNLLGETPTDPAAPLEREIAAAEESLAKGDFPQAESHYRVALFHGWLLKGTLEAFDKRLPQARKALEQATAYAPHGSAAASRALATSLLQAGEVGPAIALLTSVVDKDHQDVETRLLLAKSLAVAGQLDQAVSKLDEARAAVGDDPQMAFVLATEYLSLKRPEAAEALFSRVAQAKPMPQTHILIGRMYRDAGEYERARTALRAALAQEPTVRRAHYYLGMVALADAGLGPDRLVTAAGEFREELKLEPEDPLANDQLGEILIESERPAEALPFLQTAARVDPRPIYVFHVGGAQLALGQAAEAAQTLRRALELAGTPGADDADVQKMHYQLGLALRKLGHAEEATTHLSEARRLAAASESDESPVAKAARWAAQSSPLAALSAAERSDLLGRTVVAMARAYFNLGVLQAQSPTPAGSRERFTLAAALFASAADLDPDFPKLQMSLGIARFNARQFDQAIAPLERALAAAPDDLGLRSMLATSLLNTEAWDRAAELLRTDPERERNPSLQSAYGLALVRGGRGAEAERVLSGLVAQQGDSAELRLLLGQALLVQGKPTEAVPQLEAAARLAPDDPRVHDELGRAYQKVGRTELARQELDAAAKLKAARKGSAP